MSILGGSIYLDWITLANFRDSCRRSCHAYCCERVGREYESDFLCHKNARRQVVSSFFYNFFYEPHKMCGNVIWHPLKEKIMEKRSQNRKQKKICEQQPFFFHCFWCIFNLVQRLLIWKLLLTKTVCILCCCYLLCVFIYFSIQARLVRISFFVFLLNNYCSIHFVSFCQDLFFACYKSSF